MLDLVFVFIGLILMLPFWCFIVLVIIVTSGPPIFFEQLRAGKDKKPFKIVKFRTMVSGSEKMQRNLERLNEVDGPVFKIKNDPRFTKFGKILSSTGLDEMPQLLNILRGEMSLIGPRPLPLAEFSRLTPTQKIRSEIKPGITSLWVVQGLHSLTFSEWMKLDRDYIRTASLKLDLKIIWRTVKVILRLA